MRQIKFRVWDKEEKIMLPPATLEEIVDNIDMGLPVNITGWGCDGGNMGDQDRFVWLQYTGLKDKNGKEIYEGDIIYRKTRLFSDSPWKKERYVIRFDEKEGAFLADGITGLRHYFEIRDPFEVIGNIYEDSHLLQ